MTTSGSGFLEQYRSVVSNLTSPDDICAFVSEPVAAVVGAEYYGLLLQDRTGACDELAVLGAAVWGSCRGR